MTTYIVYCISNNLYTPNNLYKIGKTGNINNRLNNFYSTNTPERFKIYDIIICNNQSIMDKIEKKIHEILSHFRYNPNREYFQLNIDNIKSTFNLVCLLYHNEIQRGYLDNNNNIFNEDIFIEINNNRNNRNSSNRNNNNSNRNNNNSNRNNNNSNRNNNNSNRNNINITIINVYGIREDLFKRYIKHVKHSIIYGHIIKKDGVQYWGENNCLINDTLDINSIDSVNKYLRQVIALGDNNIKCKGEFKAILNSIKNYLEL